MFTPEEIRQITFERTMRGYRPEDVESFMDKVADDMEALEKEKKDLEEKLYVLAERVEKYKEDEENVKNILMQSQRLGESIIADAKEKSENIIREATIKKNNIISSAYAEIEGSEETIRRLKKEISDFKRTILGLYKKHIESLSQIPEDSKAEQPAQTTYAAEETASPVIEEVVEEPTSVIEPVVTEEANETKEFKSVSSLFPEE